MMNDNKLIYFCLNVFFVLMLTSSIAISAEYNKYLASINSMVINTSNKITLTLNKPINIKDGLSSCKSNNIDVKFINLEEVEKVEHDCIIKRRALGRIYEIIINTDEKINTKQKYYLDISKSLDGCNAGCIKLTEFESIINKRQLTLAFIKSDSYRINVNSDSDLGEDLDYNVEIQRNGIVDTIKPAYEILKNSPRKSVFLVLDERLMNGDKVKVSTEDSIGSIDGKKSFSSNHPKTADDSINYFSVSLNKDDNRDQKSIFSIKYKYDDTKIAARDNPQMWSKASPVIDIDFNNKEKKSDKKAIIKMNWSKYKLIEPKPNKKHITQRYYNAGIGFESEDNLKNKNVFINYNVVDERLYSTGKHQTRPSLGFEIGRNLDLTSEVDPMGLFERFYVARAVLDLNYTYKRDLKTTNLFNSFSFSISNKIRYLFSDEVHLRTIKSIDDEDDKEEPYFDKGIKEFWEIEMLFSLSDRLGLSITYENGKEPQFFRDDDEISLSLVYSY
jgi:hypothetical protein